MTQNTHRSSHRRPSVLRTVLPAAALLGPLANPALAQTAPAAAASDASQDTVREVVVTATRHEESIQKVPLSVQAFSQEQLDAQGVKALDDLVRLTPGLNLTRVAATGANQISIRGISSSAGSGTTGVYIDDTPIQVRNLGYGAGTAFPGIFDLDRVEVLRGPQGTLFGAGSEGGTVRFLQTEPSLTQYLTYDRAEVSTTENGAPSYEAGAAFGVPLVQDRIGLRASVFYRYDGGFIDAVNGNTAIVDPEGSLYGQSVAFTPTSVYQNDINWARTLSARLALKIAVTDTVTLSPSVFYQKRHVNDGQGTAYVLGQSNPGQGVYTRPFYLAGSSATDPALSDIDVPNNQLGDDSFTLSAVRLNWSLGPLELVSNSSFFSRNSTQWYDYTRGYIEFYEYANFPDGTYPPAGWKSMAEYLNGQHNFVQEIRLQSTDASARFKWVAGLFYSHDRQNAAEPISVNFLEHASYVGFEPDFAGYTDGAPYGPGSSAYENYLGVPLDPNSVTFNARWRTIDEQLAAFAQADIALTSQLKLTAGVRFSRTKLDFDAHYFAPDNNANAPYGYPFPCIDGYACDTDTGTIPIGAYAPGTGPFAPVYPSSTASSTNTATTPKVGLSWQINDDNLLYATAAKGFRPAGANLKVPSICNPDLATYGYLSDSGESQQPDTYRSDTVWSYEAGTKNRLADGKLVIDGSVYLIKWKNIQTDVFLPTCAYDFVDNLADATAKGFDLAVQARPLRDLSAYATIGYTKASFDGDATSPAGSVIYPGGSSIPGVGPPWTVSVGAEYDLAILEKNFYGRADFTRTSELRRVGSELPGTPQYDPLMRPDPAYSILNLRLGWRASAMELSFFIANLTDAHPLLGLGHSTGYDPQDWSAVALRPRTYGLTLTYRN